MGNRYIIDWNEYAKTARKAAAEGAVLLRNQDHVLPLNENSRVAVFGRIQFDYYKSGTGSGGLVNTRYVVSILDAMKKEPLILDETLDAVYRQWLEHHPFDKGAGWSQEPWSQEEMPLEEAVVREAAASSDTALVILGRTAGEDQDASNTEGSYRLTETEEDMLQKVCGAFQKVVVILNIGSIIDMSWIETYNPQAVLCVWQGGMEGGHGAADLLMGRVNPCGKLSDTVAKSISDYPSTRNFGGAHGDVYQEDIYVGYRYFETFAKERVLYPFGYGLSYTQFEIKEITIRYQDDVLSIEADIKNTGSRAGKEVVQVYICPPQGRLGKPLRSLAAFQKTKLLQPEESCTLQLQASSYGLSSYDDTGVTGNRSCYVMEEGQYDVYVGTDVRSAVLAGSFSLDETKVTSRCREVLSPKHEFDRMVPERDGENLRVAYQKVWPGETSVSERIRHDRLPGYPYTGDRGYRLVDVLDGRVSLDDFTAQLTEEELCCLVRGEGMCSPKATPGTAATFGGVTEDLKAYGIPCGCCADGPSGIRMDCGTYAFSLPNGTCLACTFDEEINRMLYMFEGQELRKNRIDTLLGPGINIHRNPLNGRNFEYFSEDPLLTGRIASAQLQGMGEYGVTGTVKHFAANNQEFHRRQTDAVISERALREIYLKGFEIAVKEGHAYSIMTAYGAINGYWTASNHDLLTTILRGEWNFDGMVMTDWWAEMNEDHQPPSRTNLAAMVRCQNDVYMVVPDALLNSSIDNLREALASGRLQRGHLVRSAKNILGVLLRSPVMERSLNRMSQEEQEAFEQMNEEDKVDFDIEYLLVDQKLVLDGSKIDTGRGSSVMYGLWTEQQGVYDLFMNVKVDADRLAQVPVTVSVNGTIMGTVTLNGTDGKYVEVKQSLGDFSGRYQFMKLFFAQGGMQIDEIVIRMRETTE